MFLQISTHFTATPAIPLTSLALERGSFESSLWVKPRDFTPNLPHTYEPFTPSNSEQRWPPTYYRGCWHVVSRGFLYPYRQTLAGHSSGSKGVYTPKSFIPHAASLRQAFAHCAIFPTAASRRSLDRVSVPVWPAILSDRLPIKALVSRYLTN